MSRRMNRVEEACKEELSEIMAREMKDPRVGFVTITRVKVTPDLRHAQVYVSVMGTEEEVARTMQGLESARGFMRSHLGMHLRLKFLPEIEFVRDEMTTEALRLSRLMEKAREDSTTDD